MRISINDNYPDWTWDGDPNAPWNQPDDSELYEKAYEIAEQYAADCEVDWQEFIAEHDDYCDKVDEMSSEEFNEFARSLAKDDSLIDEFYNRNSDYFWDKAIECLTPPDPPEPED